MPREIYSEGRVVGLSAYEIYLRRFLSDNPDGTPATEQEWLASSIAMGSSLLLEVPENAGMDGFWFIDIDFPLNSTLCAANTIIASYFLGTGSASGTATVLNHTDDPDFVVGSWGWRRPVYSYGKLLPDGSGYYKEENPSDFPIGNSIDITASDKRGVSGYMQFVDGLVLQPGTRNVMTFDPMLGDENKPCLRFLCNGKIQGRFRMLLTGFTLKSIIQGVSKTKITGNLANGEFLGPSAYPWANKIIFTAPNLLIHTLNSSSMVVRRELSDHDEDRLDSLSELGIYWYLSSPYPRDAYYAGPSVVENVKISDDVILQRLTLLETSGVSAFRTKVNGTWQDWREVVVAEKSAEEINITINTGGYITSSSKEVRFSIPSPVLTDLFDVRSVKIALRHAEGGYPYVESFDGSTYTMLGDSPVEIFSTSTGYLDGVASCIHTKTGSLMSFRISFTNSLKKSNASNPPSVLNNTPIGVSVNLKIVVD